jgi:outer membrane biosynthesis protein TonB
MKYLICLFALLVACGESSDVVEYKDAPPKEQPKPAPKPEVPGEKPVPVEPEPEPEVSAKTIAVNAVQSNCSQCHNSGFQSPPLEDEGQILAKVDRICNRVGNGTMPPGGNISGIEREKILNGLCR